MANTTNKKEKKSVAQTAWEKVCEKVNKKISDNSLSSEANVCAILWKNPDFYRTYDNISLDDFQNNIWKVYFEIGRQIIVDEQKNTLDELTVNFYLQKHEKLQAKFEEFGGYNVIEQAKEYVDISNIDGYVSDLHKFKTLKQMSDLGFPIAQNFSKYMDMSLEEIYQYYDALLNHTFLNAETNVKTYNVADGIFELIDKMDKGETFGMPLSGSDIISNQIAGVQEGNIYSLMMSSGGGKSFLVCRWLLPSIINSNEKICMIINEEDETRVQKELLIFYANHILGGNITKTQLRNGGFDEETKALLYKSAEKIQELKDNNNIIIAPLESYNVDIAIKIIKKYSSMGCKYFVLDTLKLGNDAKSENSWLSLQTDLVKLYDVIKPKSKNVALFVTAQLGKQSLTQRYLTNFSIGMSKNIIDTMSCVILSRLVLEDEKGDEKHSIKCFRLEGKNKKTKIPFKLDENKNYLIHFVSKNRFGQANGYQIVAEIDYATNHYKEIGYCNIMPEY